MEAIMPSRITQFPHRTQHKVTFGLVGALVALATLTTPQAAHAGGYGQKHYAALPPGYGYNVQANPNYGFGPVVRVHPHDVVSGDKIVGRDPDPFIRGQLLRAYNSRSW
jgi:hypothetical protein